MERYDVVILGGALTGAAAALRMARTLGGRRILLIEQRESFSALPEATTELFGLFLTRTLRLWDHLARQELPHHGPRFWFHNSSVVRIQDASELGARWQPGLPSFLLREDVLCEHLLAEAEREGVEVWRPAKVTSLELEPFDSRLHVSHEGVEREVQATWVLDATGRAAVLGRSLGLVEPNKSHPVAALSGRWQGDLDLDGPRFAPDTEFGRSTLVARRLCSNHFLGYGYRVSFVALGDGEISATLTWDRRVLDLHEEPDLADAYTAFLSGLPATRQLLQRAKLVREEVRYLPQVAFWARRVMGQGWALLGTASGFDDLASGSGGDHAARTIEATGAIVAASLAGEEVGRSIERYNQRLARSRRREFGARTRDRYLLHGDFDLFWPALLMDRAWFILNEVTTAERDTRKALLQHPMTGPRGWLRATWLGFANRRLNRIARDRMWTGNYGRTNDGLRLAHRTDGIGSALLTLVHGASGWALREFEDLGLVGQRALAWLRGQRQLAEEFEVETLPDGFDVAREGHERAPVEEDDPLDSVPIADDTAF